MPLYEVAILEHPTSSESQNGGTERLAFGPTAIIANDAPSAAVSAAIENPGDIKVDRNRMEVLVRPWVATNPNGAFTLSGAPFASRSFRGTELAAR